MVPFEERSENLVFTGGTRVQRVLSTALGTDPRLSPEEWLLGKTAFPDSSV